MLPLHAHVAWTLFRCAGVLALLAGRLAGNERALGPLARRLGESMGRVKRAAALDREG